MESDDDRLLTATRFFMLLLGISYIFFAGYSLLQLPYLSTMYKEAGTRLPLAHLVILPNILLMGLIMVQAFFFTALPKKVVILITGLGLSFLLLIFAQYVFLAILPLYIKM